MIAHLYCAISEFAESEHHLRSGLGEARRRLRLALGFALWTAFRKFRFSSYDASDFGESNTGDIAIRESVEQIIRARFGDRVSRVIEDKWGTIGGSYRRDQDEKKLIVIAGSGYLYVEDEGGFPDRIRGDLSCFSECKAGDKVVALGIGMNRPGASRQTTTLDVLTETAQEELRRFCKLVSVIGVRDAATRAAILAAAPDADVSVVVDPALFLAPAQALTTSRRPGPPRVSVNLPFHGPLATKILRTRLHDFARALVRLQDRFGIVFSYAQHHDAEHILPALLRTAGVGIDRVYRGSPDRLIGGYLDQDLHIGHMLHSCILASSCATPSLGLAYDSKSFGFFDLLNMGENCVHYSEWTDEWLLDRVGKLLADREPLRQRLIDRRAQLWTEWEALLDRVENCIIG